MSKRLNDLARSSKCVRGTDVWWNLTNLVLFYILFREIALMVPLLPINQLSPPDSAFFLPPLLNLQAIRLVTLFVTCFFCHQQNECNKFCCSFKRRFHILTRPPLLLQRKVWQQQAKMVQKIVIKSRLCCILFLRYAQTAFIQ